MKLNLTSFLDKKNYCLPIGRTNISLKDSDVENARINLYRDRDAFFVNGILCYASAIQSVNTNNYSWAFINSYYSVFFFCKVLISNWDYGIYYIGTTPYFIKVAKGESFTKESGNSHQLVFKKFIELFEHEAFIGEIENINNIDWFNHKREEINYRLSPMPDPSPPVPLYKYCNDIRKWIVRYMNDSIYSFDESHCYMAFPVYMMSYIIQYLYDNKKNEFISEELLIHLRKNIADANGPIDSIIKKIADLRL